MPILFSRKGASIRNVQTILREAQRRFPVMHLSPFDRVVNGDNGYIMSRQIDGTYSLKPNITKQGLLFRGDSQYHNPFNSRYKKFRGIDSIYINSFTKLLESFPLYKMFKEGVQLPDGKVIRFENPYALAYCYGLPTPFVGLTSDLDVASFYAITKWNEVKNEFELVKQGEGILYAYELRQPMNQMRSINTLGLQVFKKTYYQKSFVLQLHENTDFNKLNAVTGFRFNHDEELAHELFNKFEGGELLVPKDDILSKKLNNHPHNWQEMPEFSREELEEAYSHFEETWKMFVGLVDFGTEEENYRDALLQLPHNEAYAKYFDLNRYYDEK